MNATHAAPATEGGKVPMQRRPAPGFGFHEGTPRFWFGGDPFKTRFFDSMSLIFPGGEKFFINSVRAYRADIQDPVLNQEIDDFVFQEAQHSMVHRSFNEHMQRQGLDAVAMQCAFDEMLERMRKRFPRRINLLRTAALEHFTATLGVCFHGHPERFEDMDPAVRAAYAWHLVEEVEHRSVCYDVMERVARVTYVERVLSMLVTSVMFPYRLGVATNALLRADGYSLGQRVTLFLKGMRWLFGFGGLAWTCMGEYFAYFTVGFHPSKGPVPPSIARWRESYAGDGNAVAAAQRMFGEQVAPERSAVAA